MSNQAEVLIVGAGPVGLSAALALAKAKIPIRIIDRLAEPTNQSRAAVLQVRTLENFERLGIIDDFLATEVKIHGASIYAPGNVLLIRPSFATSCLSSAAGRSKSRLPRSMRSLTFCDKVSRPLA